jgi:hypothetical protein
VVQRLVSKLGLPALLVGIAAILAIAGSSAVLGWSYREQVHDLKSTLFDRCQASITRAEALSVALDALDSYYGALAANLTANPSPQSRMFNARLLAHVAEVRQQLSGAADLAVPPSCDVYR